MKLLLLFLLVPALVLAGEKDPKVLSKQAAESAEKFFAEAKEVSARAAQATAEEAADLKKYAELTLDEAKTLLKASEAWGNNQLRLAERYAKKAGEYCEKRGKLIDKVYKKCEDKDAKKAEGKYPEKEAGKDLKKEFWTSPDKDQKKEPVLTGEMLEKED